ncbi:hypothetical protein J3F84DRAFT_21905 [Trichoderma pleuroticola]
MLLTHISLFSRCGSRLRISDQAISYISLLLFVHVLSFPFFYVFGASFWALNIIISWRRTSILLFLLVFYFYFCALFLLCIPKNSSVAHVASFLQSRGGSRAALTFCTWKKIL